jgi:hypothetical protein
MDNEQQTGSTTSCSRQSLFLCYFSPSTMTRIWIYLDRRRRSVVVVFAILIVYLGCFNAIRKSGSVIGDDLWNASIDRVFVLPTIRVAKQVKVEANQNSDKSNDHATTVEEASEVPPTINNNPRPQIGRRIPIQQDVVVVVSSSGIDNSTTTTATAQTTTPAKTMPTTTNVPRLPVIPKPNPFPGPPIVKAWMQNETNLTAGQFMLDFAIIGYAKCGTSTMSKFDMKEFLCFVGKH